MQYGKRIFLASTILLSGLGFYAVAQDASDALRYSYLSPQGTARSMGFGSALGSIGGDFTSLSVNPAGIGVYRNSEAMFTPSLKINSTKSNYIDNTVGDNNTRFNFSNMGIVFTSAAKGRRYENSRWKAVSFGIGVNRMADFNRDYAYSGVNKSSSGAEIFAVDAIYNPNNINAYNTLAGLGYQSYLVNNDSVNGFYSVVPYAQGLRQTRSVQERGGLSEIVLSFGGNYEEKLMLGATVGMPTLRYTRDAIYTEVDNSGDPNNDFRSFDYREYMTTSGFGFNLKLGFIYKANDQFRIGAAVHTPSWFWMNDVQAQSITSYFDNGDIVHLASGLDVPDNLFDYSMTTPWRGVISASGILGKHGFITADYEYVDYASTKFNYDSYYRPEQDAVNSAIRNTYKGASNIRVGAEGRFDMLMVRLGFGYYGSPYKEPVANSDRFDISAGLGFRVENVFIDLGYVHSSYTQPQKPYYIQYPENYIPEYPSGVVPVPTANIKNSLNNIALTLGWKF